MSRLFTYRTLLGFFFNKRRDAQKKNLKNQNPASVIVNLNTSPHQYPKGRFCNPRAPTRASELSKERLQALGRHSGGGRLIASVTDAKEAVAHERKRTHLSRQNKSRNANVTINDLFPSELSRATDLKTNGSRIAQTTTLDAQPPIKRASSATRAMGKPKLLRHVTADPPEYNKITARQIKMFLLLHKSVIISKRVAAAASLQAVTVPLAHNGPHICCLLDTQHVLHAPDLLCKFQG